MAVAFERVFLFYRYIMKKAIFIFLIACLIICACFLYLSIVNFIRYGDIDWILQIATWIMISINVILFLILYKKL